MYKKIVLTVALIALSFAAFAEVTKEPATKAVTVQYKDLGAAARLDEESGLVLMRTEGDCKLGKRTAYLMFKTGQNYEGCWYINELSIVLEIAGKSFEIPQDVFTIIEKPEGQDVIHISPIENVDITITEVPTEE